MVPADANIAPGMPFGAALARNDVAGEHFLAAKNLEPQTLAGGITRLPRLMRRPKETWTRYNE